MRTLILTIIFALGATLSVAASAGSALFNGLSVDLANSTNSPAAYLRMRTALEQGESQTLIIEYRDDFQLSSTADRKQNLRQRIDRYNQIKASTLQSFEFSAIEETRDYSHLPMSLLRVNNSRALEQLIGHSQIKAVYEDISSRRQLNQSLPLIQQPAIKALGYTGKGTAVAILDSGVNYTLPTFGSCSSPGVPSSCKVVYARDFAPDDGSLDDDNHGTSVAAIALGVAPGTEILALDVFDGEDGWSSDIIAAINFSIANQAVYNIVAINLSLGGGEYYWPCDSNIFATPISRAKAAGILVAAASGNEAFKDALGHPACTPDAVSVGAVYDSSLGGIESEDCTDLITAADQVACFSNSAYYLDLLAPGAMITAAGFTYGGTSQATPHVAGAAAVMAQAFPKNSVDQWLAYLKSTGAKVTDSTNDITTPRINLYAAVAQNLGSADAINLSARAKVGLGAESLNTGVVVVGTGLGEFLVKGLGPSMEGLSGTLDDPLLEVININTREVVAEVDDWQDDPAMAQRLIDMELQPKYVAEAAAIVSLPAGPYTVRVVGIDDSTGIAQVVLRELDPSADANAINLSARAKVGLGSESLNTGVVVVGVGLGEFLVQGLGPSMEGLSGTLDDPVLEVININTKEVVAEVDDWQEDSAMAQRLISMGYQPKYGTEAAAIISLPAGAYTVRVVGYDNSTGIAQVVLREL